MVNENLHQAINSIKNGDVKTGKRLLMEVLKADPNHEVAWLWMTKVVETDTERIKCLEKVLRINPNNEVAKKGIIHFKNRLPQAQQKPTGLATTKKNNASPEAAHLQNSHATKECPHCSKTINLENKFCSHCGNSTLAEERITNSPASVKAEPPKKQNKRRNVIVFAIISLIFICGFLDMLGKNSSSNNSSPSRVPPSATSDNPYPEDFIDIVDWECKNNSIGYTVFTGKVKNTHGLYDLRFVQIRATVLDRTGNPINTRSSYIDSDILAPSATATFSVYVDNPSDEGVSCRIWVESARFDK